MISSPKQFAAITIAFAGMAAGVGMTCAEADDRLQWKMASGFPGSMAQTGRRGKVIERKIAEVSGGEIEMRFYEPGQLVPPLEMFDAVSKGSIEAAWATPAYWAGKIPAAALFTSVPFGPSPDEYLAWIYYGGGRELWEEIAHRHNIHPLFCGILTPEASGWFRKEIRTLEDLRGLKIRYLGLGGRVMQKVGASTQLIAGSDLYASLERGVVDGAEWATPAIDYSLGLHEVAEHYYFPGWHQQATLFDLMINNDKWDALSDQHKAQLEAVCGDSIRDSLAESEALQFAALKSLEEQGVTIHRWPQEILDELETAWQDVVAELSAEDADFKRVWESLSSFRANYKVWKELGYLQ